MCRSPKRKALNRSGILHMCTRAPKVLYRKLPDQVNMEWISACSESRGQFGGCTVLRDTCTLAG